MRQAIFSLLALVPFAPWSAAAVPILPDFLSAVFDPAQPVNHPYFPMTDTRTYVYRGFEDDEPSTNEYDDEGTLIGTNSEGAWRAGENGASLGFIMPADLAIGFHYFQEHAPADEALNQATIFAFIDDSS